AQLPRSPAPPPRHKGRYAPRPPVGPPPPALSPKAETCGPTPPAEIGAFDEFAPSHAHKARPQTPSIANTPAATAALRNLIGRRCGICLRRDANGRDPRPIA